MGENHPYEKYNVLSINYLYFHHPETPDPIPWTGLPSRSYPLARIAGQEQIIPPVLRSARSSPNPDRRSSAV